MLCITRKVHNFHYKFGKIPRKYVQYDCLNKRIRNKNKTTKNELRILIKHYKYSVKNNYNRNI